MHAAYDVPLRSMPVLVVVVTVVVMVVLLARGLRVAGAAGELLHQLDELIRRGVVLAGHVAVWIEIYLLRGSRSSRGSAFALSRF
jgi:hypothetical protein